MGGLKTAVNIAPLVVTFSTLLTPPLAIAILELSWLSVPSGLTSSTRKTLLKTLLSRGRPSDDDLEAYRYEKETRARGARGWGHWNLRCPNWPQFQHSPRNSLFSDQFDEACALGEGVTGVEAPGAGLGISLGVLATVPPLPLF